MERTVAARREKGGWQLANPRLNLKTGIGEDLGDPAAGLLLGKAQFRVVVNAMREIDQGLLIRVDGSLRLLLCVHECFLSHARVRGLLCLFCGAFWPGSLSPSNLDLFDDGN